MVSYGQTIHSLEKEYKTILRYRENTLKKIINTELAITFNEICLRENLLPIYTLNIPCDGAESQNIRRRRRPSDDERKNLMKNRIAELRCKLQDLKPLHHKIKKDWDNADIDARIKKKIDTAFEEVILQHKNSTIRVNQQKLIKLNGGQIKYPRQSCGYINLTKEPLTVHQE